MPESLLIANRVPVENPAGGVRLGFVQADGVQPGAYPPDLEGALSGRLASERARQHEDPTAEQRRSAARDMLRNGRYKPTGRGKPASEYLVRAATEDFPRINALVDVNNLISLEERLPISLWDLDRTAATSFIFRLGRAGEHFVFNQSGQVLEVQDLVVGCAVTADSGADGVPVVSPIKDSQLAKTTDGTYRVAACVYAPANVVSESTLFEICAGFARWLGGCGEQVEAATAVASPGAEVRL